MAKYGIAAVTNGDYDNWEELSGTYDTLEEAEDALESTRIGFSAGASLYDDMGEDYEDPSDVEFVITEKD